MHASRWSLVLPALGALLLLAPLAAAEGDADEKKKVGPTEPLAKEAVRAFRKTYRNKDPKVRCDALLELSRTRHELTVREIGRVLGRERSLAVVQAGALVLGDMKEVAPAAGDVLRELIRTRRKQEGTKELLRVIAASIGRLRYGGAHDELLELLDHEEPWVVIAAIEAIGEVGDKKALPELYRLAAMTGDFYFQDTRDDVGDPRPAIQGDRQRAARKAAAGQSRRMYPEIVKLYSRHLRVTVKKLTGEEFESLDEFEAWLDEHPEEIGRETGKTRRRRG